MSFTNLGILTTTAIVIVVLAFANFDCEAWKHFGYDSNAAQAPTITATQLRKLQTSEQDENRFVVVDVRSKDDCLLYTSDAADE